MTAKQIRVGFIGADARESRAKEECTIDNGSVLVRRLEARDLPDAAVTFPGAMMHLHPDPTGAVQSFFHEIASGRQNAWIAQAEERLIGMAVLSVESQTLARLTYLHVAGDGPHHLPAAKALAEIAIRAPGTADASSSPFTHASRRATSFSTCTSWGSNSRGASTRAASESSSSTAIFTSRREKTVSVWEMSPDAAITESSHD